MPFIQIIEYRTSRFDEVDAAVQSFIDATEGRRTVRRSTLVADRDDPGRYLAIVEFDSAEDAERNSALPETARMAEQLTKLCDAPPRFSNLDVVRRMD